MGSRSHAVSVRPASQETTKLPASVAVSLRIPRQQRRRASVCSVSPPAKPTENIYYRYYVSHSDGRVVGLLCISPISLILFTSVFAILLLPWVICSSFRPMFLGWGYLFSYERVWMQVRHVVCKYFLPVGSLAFHRITACRRAEVFKILRKSNLSFFPLTSRVFGVVPENSLSASRP